MRDVIGCFLGNLVTQFREKEFPNPNVCSVVMGHDDDDDDDEDDDDYK